MSSPGKGVLSQRLKIARYGGFPKIRGTFLGFPITRTIVFWGLYWGPLILGNYHILSHHCRQLSALMLDRKKAVQSGSPGCGKDFHSRADPPSQCENARWPKH